MFYKEQIKVPLVQSFYILQEIQKVNISNIQKPEKCFIVDDNKVLEYENFLNMVTLKKRNDYQLMRSKMAVENIENQIINNNEQFNIILEIEKKKAEQKKHQFEEPIQVETNTEYLDYIKSMDETLKYVNYGKIFHGNHVKSMVLDANILSSQQKYYEYLNQLIDLIYMTSYQVVKIKNPKIMSSVSMSSFYTNDSLKYYTNDSPKYLFSNIYKNTKVNEFEINNLQDYFKKLVTFLYELILSIDNTKYYVNIILQKYFEKSQIHKYQQEYNVVLQNTNKKC